MLGVRSGNMYGRLGSTRLSFLAVDCYDVHYIYVHLFLVIYLVLQTRFSMCHSDVRVVL